MAIGPLQHHKPLVRLAHLVGSDVFSMPRISSTFKYCVSSTPSSCMIKQVMLSALTKKIKFLELQSQWIILGDSADGEVVRPDTVVHAHQNISVSDPLRLSCFPEL